MMSKTKRPGSQERIERRISAAGRLTLCVLLLLLQIFTTLALSALLQQRASYVYGALELMGAGFAIWIYSRTGSPSYKLSWMCLLLLVPVAVCAGSLAFAALAGLVLPLGVKDSMAAASGLGWYSLAPTLLAPYSLSVSAVAFLSNVMREIFAIITIPIVAKYVGDVECASLPGAAAMDTVLPVVVGATHERITIYSFTSGVVLSLAVPLLVPAIVALPF